MSSTKTLQTGVRPSQAVKDTSKRRTGLLKDNSWIKKDIEEDEPVDVDPNYGKGILLKTQNNGESKPAGDTLTSPGSASVNSLSKRFNGSQELPDKSSTTTTPKSSVTVATSPPTTTSNKPPVPAKNPAFVGSKSFTARVFSGANSSEKAFTPVNNRAVDEKSPVSKEPPKDVTDGILSSKQTSATFTSPEKTQSSTATKTELSTKSYEQSDENAAPKRTTTITSTTTKTTTPNPASSNDKSPSPKGHSDTPSYNSSQPANNARNTCFILPLTGHFIQYCVEVRQELLFIYFPIKMAKYKTFGYSDLYFISASKHCQHNSQNKCQSESNNIPNSALTSSEFTTTHSDVNQCELCYRSLGNLEAGATLWVHREKVNCENCYKKTKDQWFH
ncbi:hypothetical protein NFI96_024353 [Prochilodus magdalenae]|nr:hypothetical protein NFI96_024353 [Prochilodus magdalenae]